MKRKPNGEIPTSGSQILDCEICDTPVRIASEERYLEMVRLGIRPRCRKNGCYRVVGPVVLGIDRTETTGVAGHKVVQVRPRRGKANYSTPKTKVVDAGNWREQ